MLTGLVGREEIILSNGNCRFRNKSGRRPLRSVCGGGYELAVVRFTAVEKMEVQGIIEQRKGKMHKSTLK